MTVRRFRVLLLVSSLALAALLAVPNAMAGPGSLPGSRFAANQPAECAQLASYAGTMQGWGELVDEDEAGPDSDNLESWTAADYDTAIATYDGYLAQLDRITPPPAAAAYHQAIRDGVALYRDVLETMKTNGPFAILAYFDQFDQISKQAAALALPLEAQCGIPLWDNDGDGIPEIGPGVATPVSDEAIATSAPEPNATEETLPVGFALDGGPIMPIGTTVQTSDAFSLTVVSVDQDAVDAVPETPPAGYQYVNVELKLGHLRDQTDTFDLISLIALGPTGAIYSAVGNSCGVVDGPLAPGDYTGTMTMTGHVCFVVNSRDIAGLAMYDQTQPPEERVYLSLDPAAGS